jgi:hypothetical protein
MTKVLQYKLDERTSMIYFGVTIIYSMYHKEKIYRLDYIKLKSSYVISNVGSIIFQRPFGGRTFVGLHLNSPGQTPNSSHHNK